MVFSEEAMNHAEQVLAQVRETWLEFPGVTAIDLGFKWSHGQMTDQLAIRVHVTEKRPLSEIPEAERFPRQVDGIPIDVIEATYGLQVGAGPIQLEAAADNRMERFEEIPLGVSIGSPNITAGTLGAKVFDLESGEAMILSNWHVLAGLPSASAGLPIWQPGPLDGGRNNDNTFAVLTRFVLGPYDAAVARVTDARPVLSSTLEGIPVEKARRPRLGMRVQKSGRTTGLTEGFIDGVNMTTMINYGAAGTRTLQGVVRIVPVPGSSAFVEISMGGDSGSVWLDQESGDAVGLHFAGEVGNAPEHALANDMMGVINTLRVYLPGQPPLPPDPPPVEEEPPPPPVDEEPSVPPVREPPVQQLSWWERLLQFFRRLFGG